jgi:hypothetical protein
MVDHSSIVLFGFNTNSEENKRGCMSYLLDNGSEWARPRLCSERNRQSASRATANAGKGRLRPLFILTPMSLILGQFPLCNVPNWIGPGIAEIMVIMKAFLGSGKSVALGVMEVNAGHA